LEVILSNCVVCSIARIDIFLVAGEILKEYKRGEFLWSVDFKVAGPYLIHFSDHHFEMAYLGGVNSIEKIRESDDMKFFKVKCGCVLAIESRGRQYYFIIDDIIGS
jgi:hypothetical protein